MCGIVGYIGKKYNALNVLISGLERLEYRGYDSAGIAYVEGKTLKIEKEKGKISNLKSAIDVNIPSNLGIGHTRWATHGIASKINSHPHKVGKITKKDLKCDYKEAYKILDKERIKSMNFLKKALDIRDSDKNE